LQGKFLVMTMVWVVSRFRLKAPPCISSSCISPLTSSGQRSRASCASQPQKSATLLPQPGGQPRKFIRTCGGIGGEDFLNKVVPTVNIFFNFYVRQIFSQCDFASLKSLKLMGGKIWHI